MFIRSTTHSQLSASIIAWALKQPKHTLHHDFYNSLALHCMSVLLCNESFKSNHNVDCGEHGYHFIHSPPDQDSNGRFRSLHKRIQKSHWQTALHLKWIHYLYLSRSDQDPNLAMSKVFSQGSILPNVDAKPSCCHRRMALSLPSASVRVVK